MSPHEMSKIDAQFCWACNELGWTWAAREVPHERDDSSSTRELWYDAGGRFLFDEADLTYGMAAEIIRIATLIRLEKP